MNATLKRRINRYLGDRGLPDLDGPGLFAELAAHVRDHAHFLSLLVTCVPEERSNMYNALAPNLRFKAKPLEEYITEARNQAEREQLPWIAEDGTLQQYYPPEVDSQSAIDGQIIKDQNTIEGALAPVVAKWRLTVRCKRCTREETFYGADKWEAVMAAREAGWIYSLDRQVEYCESYPNCGG